MKKNCLQLDGIWSVSSLSQGLLTFRKRVIVEKGWRVVRYYFFRCNFFVFVFFLFFFNLFVFFFTEMLNMLSNFIFILFAKCFFFSFFYLKNVFIMSTIFVHSFFFAWLTPCNKDFSKLFHIFFFFSLFSSSVIQQTVIRTVSEVQHFIFPPKQNTKVIYIYISICMHIYISIYIYTQTHSRYVQSLQMFFLICLKSFFFIFP